MKMEQGSGNLFVVLPSQTGKGSVIFGKNSDRPAGEVQELIYESPKHCTAGDPVKVNSLLSFQFLLFLNLIFNFKKV